MLENLFHMLSLPGPTPFSHGLLSSPPLNHPFLLSFYSGTKQEMTYRDALNSALDEELERECCY